MNEELLVKNIQLYQQSIKLNNKKESDRYYNQICSIYNPVNYVNPWYSKYGHLADSKEDFIQDFTIKFHNVLLAWKPKSERITGHDGGKGVFQNYFIGALNNHYSNQIKAYNAGKRNLHTKCPICLKWVSPLSTHLFSSHIELVEKSLIDKKININIETKCKLCDMIDVSKKSNKKELLLKHYTTKHSYLLYDKFNELYPDVDLMNTKTVSQHDDYDIDIFQNISDKNKISNIIDYNLSDIQKLILKKIIINKCTNLSYDKNYYKCTESDFLREVELLRDLLVLSGVREE